MGGNRFSYLGDYIDKKKLQDFVVMYKDDDQTNFNHKGYSLLSYAIFRESSTIITFLLDRDHIDVCKAGTNKKSPLYTAVEKVNFDLVKTLIEHGGHPSVQTAFLKAIEVGTIEIIKFLVENGALINFDYSDKSSPLTAAIKTGNVDVATYLLEKGADWTILNQEVQKLCLSEFVQSNHFHMVKFLVNNLNINLNIVLIDGYNILTLAVDKGNFRMIKLFLEYGADVNALDSNDRSPLTLAVSKDQLQVAVHLLRSGADVSRAKKDVIEDYCRKNDDFKACLESLRRLQTAAGSGHEAAS